MRTGPDLAQRRADYDAALIEEIAAHGARADELARIVPAPCR